MTEHLLGIKLPVVFWKCNDTQILLFVCNMELEWLEMATVVFTDIVRTLNSLNVSHAVYAPI